MRGLRLPGSLIMSLVPTANISSGCSSGGGVKPLRGDQSNPGFTFVLEHAPEENSTLEEGILFLSGRVESDLDFHPHSPLQLQIQDVTSGLWSMPLITRDTTTYPDSTFDPQTGAFVIGDTSQSAPTQLAEGEKIIALQARDVTGETITWVRRDYVPPTYTPTLAEVRTARETWGA